MRVKSRPPSLAVLLAGLALPIGAVAQPAPYLKDAQPWEQSATGISGRWIMQRARPNRPPPGAAGAPGPARPQDGNAAPPEVARTEDGKVPSLLPAAQAVLDKRLAMNASGKPFSWMGATCTWQGIPLMMFAAVEGPVQIFETPGQVMILSQELNEVWQIYLQDTHHRIFEPTWHGDSIGHWEGDTLVVDTIGLTDKTTVDYAGTPHSEDLRVVTRIRRTDPTTLELRATMYDPKTFAEPWTRRVLYKKARPDQLVEEEVCDNQRNGPNANGETTFQTSEDLKPKQAAGKKK
ncbi:MAG TPA: hypothetical protein VL358_06910 [Caulobacteraceae bacterium]|jgi:hypothetical protein|nr:hypothetical protein [Caulobacteraceae bacterium]